MTIENSAPSRTCSAPPPPETRRTSARQWPFVLLLLLTSACAQRHPGEVAAPGDGASEPGKTPATAGAAGTVEPSVCPDRAQAPELLPRVAPEHRTLAYWLERVGATADLDEVLLSADDLADHNLALRDSGNDLLAEVDLVDLNSKLQERFDYLRQKFDDKAYVASNGEAVPTSTRGQLDPALLPVQPAAELRVALAPIQLHCAPTRDPYYTPALDLRFNRNHCSVARPQEVLQVIAPWPGDLLLARTRYSYGWIPADAPLSPVIPPAARERFVLGPRVALVGARAVNAGGATVDLPDGTLLPRVNGQLELVHVASASGFFESEPLPTEAVRSAARPMTRRAVLEEAFHLLDQPYGWGGEGGGRDCSRFLLDIFASFGLELPRHSASMAQAGTFSVDVSKVTNEREKLLLIDEAAKDGVVLLSFPGHIMLYLGRDTAGTPMVVHAFAEYLAPCAEKDAARPKATETLLMVDRITVSDLELGRGTSRTAFVQRIDRVTVLGRAPSLPLQGVAQVRRAAPVVLPAKCRDYPEVAFFHSPKVPNTDQPVRVILTASRHQGPGELTLFDPDGNRVAPALRVYGGPPYGLVGQLEAPQSGKWTAVFGDGSDVAACMTFTVRRGKPKEESNADVAWTARNRWSVATENLYATWVEALLDYPPDEDVVWKNMHSLVQDPVRNILFDHLSLGEDGALKLEPDCADLPYMLRAYFAWKAGLPYGFRRCDRGKAGRPPRCNEVNTNLMPREKPGDVASFSYFANRHVRNGVHSASGRTAPDADGTDFYPVELTREALRPGTLYADPYGHLLTIVDWLPQGSDQYGVLLAVDAQPDGTVGRRRFWRGTFLFTPETTDVGAGFKAFRPVIVDPQAEGGVRTLTNAELVNDPDFPRFSRQMYEGTVDDFYLAVEGLINPRPLDAGAVQLSLVDALEEGIARRLVSVTNAEDYLAARGDAPIEMPTGYAVFETSGAWEDFSTPSRDMRLLIAIDTVVDFPTVVRRVPERFGLKPEEAEAAAVEVEALLAAELGKRGFSYNRSDGSAQQLTLQDVVERKAGFEMAYHPNDCIELRWAAPEGSTELATCDRHAPREHRERMASYRSWFIERRRPPR